MKLSEAILLGSVGTEQGYGPYAILPTSKKTCALGAALFAVGPKVATLLPDEWQYGTRTVSRIWPWTETKAPYPKASGLFHPIANQVFNNDYNIIWQLNDVARWTRPQIAAWVAELEKVYDPDPAPVAEPVQDAVEVQ